MPGTCGPFEAAADAAASLTPKKGFWAGGLVSDGTVVAMVDMVVSVPADGFVEGTQAGTATDSKGIDELAGASSVCGTFGGIAGAAASSFWVIGSCAVGSSC